MWLFLKIHFITVRRALSQYRENYGKNSFIRSSLYCPYFSHFTLMKTSTGTKQAFIGETVFYNPKLPIS